MGKLSGRGRFLRNPLSRLLPLIAALVLIELMSALIYLVLEHRWFSYADLQQRRDVVMATSATELDLEQQELPRWMRPEREVVHPYAGWVLDPTQPGAEGVHEYGFHDLEAAFEPQQQDRIVIALFGGSFAGQIWQQQATLVEELVQLSPWAGHDFVVVDATLAGYKQPQQCMALQYLLTLGAHFDLVINIDGFNDIVLPWFDNARWGTFPFFPRVWPAHTVSLSDEQTRHAVAAVDTLNERRRRMAELFSSAIPRRLVSANLIWALADPAVERSLRAHEQALMTLAAQTSYQQSGPPSSSNRDAVLAASAQVWARSSRLMAAVAAHEGFLYFHFLQPNQYVPGSKPLHPEEIRLAFRPDAGYGPHARDGYPLLMEAGSRLARSGVRFFDLTGIFANEHRAVYADACCHVNPLGKELVARRIGSLIRETLDAEGWQPDPNRQ